MAFEFSACDYEEMKWGLSVLSAYMLVTLLWLSIHLVKRCRFVRSRRVA